MDAVEGPIEAGYQRYKNGLLYDRLRDSIVVSIASPMFLTLVVVSCSLTLEFMLMRMTRFSF